MKSPESRGLPLPQYRAPVLCEACGAEFMCGAALAGCWCQEVELSEAARTKLRSLYQNCLCRACLENYAEGEKV